MPAPPVAVRRGTRDDRGQTWRAPAYGGYARGVAYGARAVETAGLRVDKDIATGFAIPLVGFAVWLGLRRFRKSIEKDERK